MSGTMHTLNDHHQSPTVAETELRRVYVIDDEFQVLTMIQMQLEAAGYDVVSYSHSADFVAELPRLAPGIVISDQVMPEVEGLEIQAALQQHSPRLPLILMSGFPDTRISVQAMRKGAITVLDKPYDKADLLAAVSEAMQELQKTLDDDDQLPPPLPAGQRYLDRLSGREREVVDLIYSGATNKSTGIQLGISIKTVEKHRGKAMKKMEVSNLAELVRLINREVS